MDSWMDEQVDEKEWNFVYDAYTVEDSISLSNISEATHPPVDHVIRSISAVTCALSMMGSVAIILSYVLIKDIRSKARELLVHLSVMDLTYATANFIGTILQYDKYTVHRHFGHAHDNYERVCRAQAFFAVYGTIGSMLWTLGVAVYLYYRVVSYNVRLTKRVVRVLYVVCYVFPLYMSLWLLVRKHYGYPQNANYTGGWCAIVMKSDANEKGKFDQELLMFMVNDIWILLTFVTIIPIYLIIHCQIKAEIKECGYQYIFSSGEKHLALLRADQKFLLVPVGFIMLRVWDVVINILFLYSQPSVDQYKLHFKYQGLIYLSAIGDCGQGFLNFLLFCVLQKRVRQYTLGVICKCLCRHHQYRKQHANKICNEIVDDGHTASCTPSQMSNYSSDAPRDWIEE